MIRHLKRTDPDLELKYHDEPERVGASCRTHLCGGGDDGLQRRRRPGGIAGVATGVVRSVVMVVVTIGSGTFQKVLPACRRFPLWVKGGGRGKRT